MLLIAVALFFSSLLVSLVLTYLVRNVAVARGWCIGPVFEHHLHEGDIPRIGGVAIYFTFVSILTVLLLFARLFRVNLGFSSRVAIWILIPATLVWAVGLVDDFRGVGPYAKFAVQIGAAAILFLSNLRIMDYPGLLGPHRMGYLGAFTLTVLWVLWITNAFNLIDGLDGLATGSALFATLAVFVGSLFFGHHEVSFMGVVLVGTLLGFLRYNFNPATIFLGDSGSLFIGFMLSALAIVGSQKTPTLVAVAIPVVAFGLPMLDAVISVVRRFLNGQPLFGADREHIHHKLLQRGLSQRQVVVILYAVSALLGILSLFTLYPGQGAVGVVFVVIAVGVWFGVQHLGYNEFLELRRVAQRTVEQKQIIRNNLMIRRAAEALKDAKTLAEVHEILDLAFRSNDFGGFRLEVLGSADAAPGSEAAAALSYDWQKPSPEPKSLAEAWRLSLELVNASGHARGRFTVSRANPRRPLMVDINLLGGLCNSLVVAIDRVLPECEPLPQAETRPATARALSTSASGTVTT